MTAKAKRMVPSKSKDGPPARSLAARENQLIAAAVDLAERQIREGTASSQVITHFLKLGTTVAMLEKAKLESENELLRAKTEALANTKKLEELFSEAIEAMGSYRSLGEEDD